ncbi:MAG TPA: DUF4440 domain-containing protein [Gemmatimonadaceae bacterium]|nr:DUF4440 domain-containing protein [Gemmatimonadaceae bacterium]
MRLKTLCVLLFVAFPTWLSAQTSADEAQIRERIAAHQRASERGDLRGLVDVYAIDAQTVDPDGGVLRGRDAIEADYRSSLASAAARSGRHHTHPPESVRIQFVTPNVAVVEAATVSVGGRDPAGKPLPDWRGKLLTVWRKQATQWLVVYQRIMPATSP